MTLHALEAALAREGGLLAGSLVDGRDGSAGEVFGPLVAAGQRARPAASEYAFVIESVFEGYLLHYAHGRIVAPSDPDLSLLCGDHLYALGLSRLAALGDLEAVAELADLITLCARAHASSPEPDRAVGEARGLWAGTALALAGGAWDEHQRSKRRSASDDHGGEVDSVTAARERAARLGLLDDLERALIAFDCAVKNAQL